MTPAYNRFVDYIMGYESDTFSASASKIKRAEASKIVDNILDWYMEEKLDGVRLDGELSDIRAV